MSKMARVSCFWFLIVLSFVKGDELEYYWREYKGIIPSDALPAGKDINGRETYIGQIYFHSHGLFVVQIFPGMEENEVAFNGVHKLKKDVKILCTKNKELFKWMPTSNTYFHLNTTLKHPVPGGYDFPSGILHIGRLIYQGHLKIGKINSFLLENAIFHFPHTNTERKANFYQVLVYEDEVKIDRRLKITSD